MKGFERVGKFSLGRSLAQEMALARLPQRTLSVFCTLVVCMVVSTQVALAARSRISQRPPAPCRSSEKGDRTRPSGLFRTSAARTLKPRRAARVGGCWWCAAAPRHGGIQLQHFGHQGDRTCQRRQSDGQDSASTRRQSSMASPREGCDINNTTEWTSSLPREFATCVVF